MLPFIAGQRFAEAEAVVTDCQSVCVEHGELMQLAQKVRIASVLTTPFPCWSGIQMTQHSEI